MSIASELNKLVQIFKNWTPTVSIPPATADTLGGVKVGDGLEVTEDGTLSANGGGGYEPIVITMTITNTDNTMESTMDPADLLDLYEADPIQFGRVIIHVISTMENDESDAVMIPESVTYVNDSDESRRLKFVFGDGMYFSCDDTGFHLAD